MAESSNAIGVAGPRTELSNRSRASQGFPFGTTLDWRRLTQIQGLSLRQSVINKPTTVLRQGQIASSFFVLVDGWGVKYKQLGNGRRQILSFLLPGDPATLGALSQQPMAHSVQLLPDSVVDEFDPDAINRKVQDSEDLQAFISATYDNELARADELLASLGRRSAKERIAHLMLEFDARLSSRGAIVDGYIVMPLRQHHLADALGLTTIHVNRTLRALRDENLIDVRGGVLRILHRDRLVALANFEDSYLSVGTLPT